MNVREAPLPGVLVIEPDVYTDDRGSFLETWNEERYHEHGIRVSFVQDNLSTSRQGVLRGLHFQNPHPQAKLVSVLRGSVYDVIVDVRKGSPTFREWHGVELSADNRRQLFIPEGFAHGFVVTDGPALFHYKCSDVYAPGAEHSIRWDDPALGVEWPVSNPILSEKDAAASRLDALSGDALGFPRAETVPERASHD